jgi:hypothetical protein
MQHVKQVTLKKSEFVKQDQAVFSIEAIRDKKGKIKQLHAVYREYPLYDRGYGNYQELNVNLVRLIKYTRVDMYYVRDSWNGTGYFPICSTKLQLDGEFFNFAVSDNNAKDIVLELLKRLKNVLENNGERGDCYYATYYFPL